MTLISDEYRNLNAKHHFNRPEWGRQSMKHWEMVKDLADQIGVKSMLDYGCGKQSLKAALEPFDYRVIGYDPAFGELSASPDPSNLVICTDVLEHVEPEYLDAVIADLVRVTKGVGLFIVATRESKHKMPDGSSPHRIVKPKAWWMDILQTNFKVLQDLGLDENVFGVVVGRK